MNDRLSKKIYSVSELTAKLKLLLEEQFPMVWICGEISNLRTPTSGHSYFTLKDDKAQISTVLFKGHLRHLKFELEDGMSIVGLGRISLYEPRGTYQIILEYAEPMGAGALQMAFEQLKRKLDLEGFFDPAHKTALPFLPARICVVTSPTGAVIRDILNVVYRRFPGLPIDIIPVRVQGDQAAEEIACAIGLVNQCARADVVILARGGGSLEDLSAFNSEIVARAIFASTIPVVSAIGHETDYTIADFVADLRAPTPSAAAELVVPVKAELQAHCVDLYHRCTNSLMRCVSRYRGDLLRHRRALVHPVKKVQDLQMRTDDMTDRLQRASEFYFQQRHAAINEFIHKLFRYNPINYIKIYKAKVSINEIKLLQSIIKLKDGHKGSLNTMRSTLIALSPLAVLQRGYSITRTIPENRVVTQAGGVVKGQALEILLAQGRLDVKVQ